MTSEAALFETPSKGALWTGRVLSTLPVLLLLLSGTMKLTNGPQVVKSFAELGYPTSLVRVLGVVEVTCTILYIIPQTAYMGAILLTGYLGGAVATHARLQQPVFFMPALLGVFVWLGLYLRDPRFRKLGPLRS